MEKVVLDTNVLVSALLTSGTPAAIVDLIAEGKLILFYNEQIIGGYWNVLQRKKFGFSFLQVSRLIESIVKSGIAAKTDESSLISMPDEDDRVFYDLAKTSGAFLITGNIKHFPQESFVITPADFLRSYAISR